MTPEQSTVEQVLASLIKRGDTIWAPDDNDWLEVRRIVTRSCGPLSFRRLDNSLADFDPADTVLRKVEAEGCSCVGTPDEDDCPHA